MHWALMHYLPLKTYKELKKMNKKLIPLILAGTSLLTACDEAKTVLDSSKSPATASISKEDAIAVVNGVYISKASLTTLENELAQRSQGQSFPKEKLIEELIQRELLIQDASQKQLDQSAEFTERLATIKKSLLSQAAIQNFLKSSPVTDADLEAEYNKTVAGSGTEYKARHILVKSEDEAKQLIKELDGGADFVELAKTKSTGPSGPQGGDLGWFAEGQMVAPFSEAVIALEDNKYTTEAVQTQFGWHVILREGSRAQTPPPFESVKEQIRPMLQRQKMQDFLTNLRKQATVEVLLKAPAKVVEPVAEITEEVKPEATKTVEDTTKEAAQVVETAVDTTEKAVESVEKAADTVAK